MTTESPTKAGWASTWMTVLTSDVPVSITGFGEAVTSISVTGGGPPVPLPPEPLAQAGVFLAALTWLAHHLAEPLGAAVATPARPIRGMLMTTASATTRRGPRNRFICCSLTGYNFQTS